MHNEDINCPHCGKQTTLTNSKPIVRKLEPEPTPFRKLTPEELYGEPKVPWHKLEARNPAPARNPEMDATIGYVLAFLIPLIGFFYGLWFLTTGRQGRGIAIMATSVVMGLIYLAIFENR